MSTVNRIGFIHHRTILASDKCRSHGSDWHGMAVIILKMFVSTNHWRWFFLHSFLDSNGL